jgi:GNAT superfamily N-acetyltransferase
MCDEWMAGLELPLTAGQFRRLPRNPAYRYTHDDGVARVSPRPRYYHALLELAAAPDPVPPQVPLRPLRPEDWEALEPVFAAAFADQPPFAGLDDDTRLTAARRSLTQTRTGGDGPWVEAASFVAATAGSTRPAGGLLVTLLPDRDPSGWDSYHWDEPPPADAVARRLGRPHLTWVFVAPPLAGRGVGTALLAAASASLLTLGYRELASTFLLGNESSMLWHWRNGFRLLPYPGSRRRP